MVKESKEQSVEELAKQIKDLTAKVDALEKGNKKSTKPRAPSKYALFMKENYAQVKQDNSELSMGEISKIIGKMWKEKDN